MTNPLKPTMIFALCAALMASQASDVRAGGLDARNVPSKAGVVGHVDLDAFRSSKLAATFAKEIAEAKADLSKQLKGIGVPLSADDFFNASSVTFWAEGDETERGAMIVDGIDATKIASALRKLKGHTMRGALHQIDDTFIGFTGRKMVFADDKASIKATLKVLAGGGKSLAQTSKAKRIRSVGGVLLLAAFDEGIAKKIQKEADSAIFKNVSLKRGTVTVSESGRTLVAKAALETTDVAGADQLSKLAAGAITFLTVASDDPTLGKLLDGIDIKSSGTTVTISLALPFDKLKQLKNLAGAD